MYGLKPVPFMGSISSDKLPSGAKARVELVGFMYGLRPIPFMGEIDEEDSSAAKAGADSVGFMRGLKPPPPSELSFSADCEVSS
jgi:hypothetical protein